MPLTAGTLKAAELISDEFRRMTPAVPESSREILAELIDSAAGVSELVEIFESILKRYTQWRELYAPTEESAGGGE